MKPPSNFLFCSGIQAFGKFQRHFNIRYFEITVNCLVMSTLGSEGRDLMKATNGNLSVIES